MRCGRYCKALWVNSMCRCVAKREMSRGVAGRSRGSEVTAGAAGLWLTWLWREAPQQQHRQDNGGTNGKKSQLSPF